MDVLRLATLLPELPRERTRLLDNLVDRSVNGLFAGLGKIPPFGDATSIKAEIVQVRNVRGPDI